MNFDKAIEILKEHRNELICSERSIWSNQNKDYNKIILALDWAIAALIVIKKVGE